MVDGCGDLNMVFFYLQVVQWLYLVSYVLKFVLKVEGCDYVVLLLEVFWSVEDLVSFVVWCKDEWVWIVMICIFEGIGFVQWQVVISKVCMKLGEVLFSFCYEFFVEGFSLQILYVGVYDDEGFILVQLYDEVMFVLGYIFVGFYYEIYFSDLCRIEVVWLKIVLWQLVWLIGFDEDFCR